MDVKAQGLDLYNTIVSGMGSNLKLGPKNHESQTVGKIMAQGNKIIFLVPE